MGSPLGVRGCVIKLEANYEFAQRRFKELNPYRPAEFTREWNVNRNVNDVGIVTLPGGKGHLVIAAFVKNSGKPSEVTEKVLAGVGRAAWDELGK